jgi:hypothetical protein
MTGSGGQQEGADEQDGGEVEVLVDPAAWRFGPARRMTRATRKKRPPRPTMLAPVKPRRLSLATPAAIVNTL